MKEWKIQILVFIIVVFIIYIIINTIGYFLCKSNPCENGKNWNCYPNKCKFWGWNERYSNPTN